MGRKDNFPYIALGAVIVVAFAAIFVIARLYDPSIFTMPSTDIAGSAFLNIEEIPEGYAPPWDPYASTITKKNTYLTVSFKKSGAGTSQKVNITINTTSPTKYIYKYGYYTKKNITSGEQAWYPFTFPQATVSGSNWIRGKTGVNVNNIPYSAMTDEEYIIIYACEKYEWSDGEFICGPRDAEGDYGYWTIEQYDPTAGSSQYTCGIITTQHCNATSGKINITTSKINTTATCPTSQKCFFCKSGYTYNAALNKCVTECETCDNVGTTRCALGGKIEECNADNCWSPPISCSAGEACVDDVCMSGACLVNTSNICAATAPVAKYNRTQITDLCSGADDCYGCASTHEYRNGGCFLKSTSVTYTCQNNGANQCLTQITDTDILLARNITQNGTYTCPDSKTCYNCRSGFTNPTGQGCFGPSTTPLPACSGHSAQFCAASAPSNSETYTTNSSASCPTSGESCYACSTVKCGTGATTTCCPTGQGCNAGVCQATTYTCTQTTGQLCAASPANADPGTGTCQSNTCFKCKSGYKVNTAGTSCECDWTCTKDSKKCANPPGAGSSTYTGYSVCIVDSTRPGCNMYSAYTDCPSGSCIDNACTTPQPVACGSTDTTEFCAVKTNTMTEITGRTGCSGTTPTCVKCNSPNTKCGTGTSAGCFNTQTDNIHCGPATCTDCVASGKVCSAGECVTSCGGEGQAVCPDGNCKTGFSNKKWTAPNNGLTWDGVPVEMPTPSPKCYATNKCPDATGGYDPYQTPIGPNPTNNWLCADVNGGETTWHVPAYYKCDSSKDNQLFVTQGGTNFKRFCCKDSKWTEGDCTTSPKSAARYTTSQTPPIVSDIVWAKLRTAPDAVNYYKLNNVYYGRECPTGTCPVGTSSCIVWGVKLPELNNAYICGNNQEVWQCTSAMQGQVLASSTCTNGAWS